ncbi:MAG TPA: ABC transporter ATP-binding protein [Bacilli bacterium]
MILQVENIGKRFGGISALQGVSFAIREGEIYGLIGPNGAGKTTMFNLITAMFAPTSGQIRFMGERISGLKTHRITKKGICRTFQNIRLFARLSVMDNVMVGSHCRGRSGVFSGVLRTKAERAEERNIRERAEQLLQLVGLYPERDVTAENLSYGKQRRLEIARALASEPKLLLLDEPAAGMNEKETQDLAMLIRQIRAQNITVLLIEHDMPLVMKLCDRIAVLNFGQKIAEGTPQEVRGNQDVIAAYLGTDEGGEIA